jgi:glycyl-tRNA synthetase beta chain
MADFLLEIGLEEVPARMIAGAEAELGRRVNELLTRERLLGPIAKVTTYSTPRRLAVLVEGVLASQADTEEQLTGPSWKVAFKDSVPTAAAEAFAKKAGVAVAALEKVTNAKGEYVGAEVKRQGRAANELLATELPKEIAGIYWAKNMYWRAGKPERFVRPVRWVVALLDAAVVPLEIAGIKAGNTSRGHRILHGEAPVTLAKATDYAEALRKAYVVVDVAERRQSIRKALDAATRTVTGARWREDEPLIETVVHLTEWPSVVLGNFESEYLALPEEVLVTVMRDHQKYFAVEDANGKLAPHFLAVLNTAVDDKGRETIRHGNARVLTARFKDAHFFWDFDQKTPLAERVESLKNVTFQKELGSYYWKTEANLKVVKELADYLDRIASMLAAVGADDTPKFDRNALLTAVRLAKTDLTSELVKEFTELQGIIGGLYADAQGLGKTVAQAIYDQYTPASTDDAIPKTVEGQLFGLADRIQTITAMFSIGNAPTGSKDPFALRRAANAIVKILAESGLPLTLGNLVAATGPSTPEQVETWGFLAERVEFYLKDVRGYAYDVTNAVMAAGYDDVRDAIARAEALTNVRGSEDFLAIAAAFKRIKNIVRQAEEKGEVFSTTSENGKFYGELVEPEEKALIKAYYDVAVTVSELRGKRDYRAALETVATLRPAVDAFFEKVMVMAPDPKLRQARLGMIRQVREGLAGIADFSEIVTG